MKAHGIEVYVSLEKKKKKLLLHETASYHY